MSRGLWLSKWQKIGSKLSCQIMSCLPKGGETGQSCSFFRQIRDINGFETVLLQWWVLRPLSFSPQFQSLSYWINDGSAMPGWNADLGFAMLLVRSIESEAG